MAQLIFNEVLRISADGLSGFFRVVAQTPDGLSIWLAYAGGAEGQEGEAVGADRNLSQH